MTIVQRNRFFLLGVAAAVVGAAGCKKYPDGPAFSLKSKTARLVGEWELVEGDFDQGGADLFFEFEDDGDLTVTTIYSSASGASQSFIWEGEWEFEDNKEELEIEVDGDVLEFDIMRLTNSELFLEGKDQYANEDYEFEKQ